jgi:hypothetical protein
MLTTYSTANACYKDAADLHAQLEEYPQAIQRYEQVADQSLTSALTKYSVKEYWLRACLCALAMKVSAAHVPELFSRHHLGLCHRQTKHTEVHVTGPYICIHPRV